MGWGQGAGNYGGVAWARGLLPGPLTKGRISRPSSPPPLPNRENLDVDIAYNCGL